MLKGVVGGDAWSGLRFGDRASEQPDSPQAGSTCWHPARRRDDHGRRGCPRRARRTVAMDRDRIERQLRDLALEHVRGGLSDDAYLARQRPPCPDRSGGGELRGRGPRRPVRRMAASNRGDVALGGCSRGERRLAPRQLRAHRRCGEEVRVSPSHPCGIRAWARPGAARGCHGAPDRRRTRVSNRRDPDRGPG